MKKKIGLAFAAFAAVLVALMGYAALQSPDYVITREIAIQAPAEKIFPHLNNNKMAEKWGPWLETDPDAKMTYSGPDDGEGSRASWEGGKQLGKGSATIVESVPNQKVRMKLEYTEPMAMTQESVYSVRSEGNQSIVTWTVTGQNTFMGRFMCIFFNMDKMVGGMFEKGLSKLKTLVESQG